MTDLETQLSAYGEQIESGRSPVGLVEATRPDMPVVTQSTGSRASELSWRRTFAAAVMLVAVVGLAVWAVDSTSGGQDPMLPPAATTSLPTSTAPNEPLGTTSGDDSLDHQETTVDEATLEMLRSYVELRWSGDLDGSMARVADPDLLSGAETRDFLRYYVADPWFSWLSYSQADQFPDHVLPFRDDEGTYLRRARTAMVGPLIFELELGTELIAMDCEHVQTRGTLIQCFADATNVFHPPGTASYTHIFEFFVVNGRIFAVGSMSYSWAPPEAFTVVDESLRDAWRKACHLVFEDGTGFVPSYPDTVEGWTEVASSCAEFALEHLASTGGS